MNQASDIRRQRARDLCTRVQLVTGAARKEVSRDVAHQLTAVIEALLNCDGEALQLATERGHDHLSKQLGERRGDIDVPTSSRQQLDRWVNENASRGYKILKHATNHLKVVLSEVQSDGKVRTAKAEADTLDSAVGMALRHWTLGEECS